MSAAAPASSALPLYDDARAVVRLVAEFENRTLPKAEWTHGAHLTMGFWYSSHLPPATALDAMRAGILRLNESHGVASTPTSGYHETITRAYMRLIGAHLAEDGGGGEWHQRANRVLERLGTRDLLFTYYTRERLMSPAARAAWMEPDLRPLPSLLHPERSEGPSYPGSGFDTRGEGPSLRSG
jgi:hypothetical protein